jgi:hypothetical protein
MKSRDFLPQMGGLPADERCNQREDEGDREPQQDRDNDNRRREVLETAQQHSRLPFYRLAIALVSPVAGWTL